MSSLSHPLERQISEILHANLGFPFSRFYGNRSLCYNQLELCERAQQDAKEVIRLVPDLPLGYMRLGKALMGMEVCQGSFCILPSILPHGLCFM